MSSSFVVVVVVIVMVVAVVLGNARFKVLFRFRFNFCFSLLFMNLLLFVAGPDLLPTIYSSCYCCFSFFCELLFVFVLQQKFNFSILFHFFCPGFLKWFAFSYGGTYCHIFMCLASWVCVCVCVCWLTTPPFFCVAVLCTAFILFLSGF